MHTRKINILPYSSSRLSGNKEEEERVGGKRGGEQERTSLEDKIERQEDERKNLGLYLSTGAAD